MTQASIRPASQRRPFLGTVSPPAQPAAYEFKFPPIRSRYSPALPVPRPFVGRIPGAARPAAVAFKFLPSVARFFPQPAPPRPFLGSIPSAATPPRLIRPTVVRLPVTVLPAARPFVGRAPRAVVASLPGKLIRSTVARLPLTPQSVPRPFVGQIPPASQPGAYDFRFSPVTARYFPLPPTPRPFVGKVPPATNLVVTRRPFAPIVVRLPAPIAPTSRPYPGRISPAHRPVAPAIMPVLASRFGLFWSPRQWPRPQSLWLFETRVLVFPFGPRFTIPFQSLEVSISAPGSTFTIRDPGQTVQLPKQ
jgi:hypothetical protein